MGKEITFAASATQSSVFESAGATVLGIYFPTAMSNASLDIHVAEKPDGVFGRLNYGGSAITITPVSGEWTRIDPPVGACMDVFKLVGASQESAARTIKVKTKNLK